MQSPSLTAAVRAELLARPGVTEAAHRFGGVAFHLGGREIGHLHGETVADLPFPAHIRDELVASGRVVGEAGSDWVTRQVAGPQDVAAVVELFRIGYEHAAAQLARSGPAVAAPQPAEHAPQPHAGRLPSLRGLLRRRRA